MKTILIILLIAALIALWVWCLKKLIASLKEMDEVERFYDEIFRDRDERYY